MTMMSQFDDMTSSSNFFGIALFLLLSLVTGSSFMSILLLVLELWQFSFIKDWPEIWKSELPLSGFSSIFGDWGELGVPNLAQMFLMKCYWMLQKATVTAFTVSELLKKHQQGRDCPLYTHTRVKILEGSSLSMGWLVFILIHTYAVFNDFSMNLVAKDLQHGELR